VADRAFYRIGAGAAIIGAILAIVFNILHPRPSGDPGDTEAHLRLVADSDIWLVDHIALGIAILLTTLGLITILRSVEADGEAAWAWSRLAIVAALISASFGMAVIAVDGLGLKAAADSWASSQDKAGALLAAGTAEEIAVGLFTWLIIAQFGALPLLAGMALSNSSYPKWLGTVALLAGALGLVTGLVQAFSGLTTATATIMFPIASIAFTVVTLVAAINLWRRTEPAVAT
jgi:hypothetical protein